MRDGDLWQSHVRRARFESFEPRLAFTAQPLGDFFLDQGERLEHHYGELTSALGGVHDTTGVNYARSVHGLTGQGQTVAIVDSGIAYDHVALGAGFGPGHRVVGGWDFAENDADPYDDAPAGFHGTHVAGIVGSTDATYRGVAPGADLVSLRVFNDQGAGYLAWVENALQWVHQNRLAFANPITAVNLSLGTNWNSDRVPQWATLEDEFAQLEADGVFIAVSAGNSFGDFRTPGLSYPAASSHVVPVASVDQNGQLSDFSQRSSRVLAAPGRLISSTVPDFLLGADGVANDFAAASGTSMAAPYVAGASVLVRQAMLLAGYQNITQDTLYQHLRNTADVIHDSATNADYFRIDVQAAVDALLPKDDYGSTADTAHQFGTLNGETSLSGRIGRSDDADFFRFTAGQSGTLKLNLAGDAQPLIQFVGQNTTAVDGTLSLNVTAGQSYTFSLASSGHVGSYELRLSLQPSWIDLGPVDFLRLDGQNMRSGETWYQLRGVHDGTLTVQAFFDRSLGKVDLALYNARQELLAASKPIGAGERADAAVAAGEQVFLKITGSNRDVDLQVTNLVSLQGSDWKMFGTSGDDQFLFDASDGSLAVNGVQYSGVPGRVTVVTIAGADGQDGLSFSGTRGDDRVSLRPGSLEAVAGGYSLRATGVENVQVSGREGHDTLSLYDSAGNDTLVLERDSATLKGDGFSLQGRQFEQIYAYASRGGYDTAQLYDSSGNDTLVARSDNVTLSGAGYYNVVRQFDEVRASATGGGQDVARLYDSAGDDTFVAGETVASLSGTGYRNVVEQFDRVYAYATLGGNDVAHLYDSAGNDTFVAEASSATMTGRGFSNLAQHFDVVHAYATGGGNDVARFYDSPGDDVFTASDKSASMSGRGFSNRAELFDRVYANATRGGEDVARLYDSAGNDTFVANQFSASLSGASFYNSVQQFDRVYAYATSGGLDVAKFYDSPGDDLFTADSSTASMTGPGFSHYAEQFDRVCAYATRGGQDVARLYDSTGNDTLLVAATSTSLSGSGFSNLVDQFEQVHVYASQGTDRAVFSDVGKDSRFLASGNLASAQETVFKRWAYDFDRVTAIARRGETALAEVHDVDFLFEQIGKWG